MKLRDLACPYCGGPHAALKIDVKGRPYLTCSCGTRAFTPALRDAVHFLAVTEPLLAAHHETTVTDLEYAAKWRAREAEVAAAFSAMLRAQEATSNATPAASSQPTLATKNRRTS